MDRVVDLIQFSGYQILEKLYSGSRTVVYRALWETETQPVVIKYLKREYPTFNELLQFRNQYTITKNLDIPGIVYPHCLETYRNSYALVMEDVGGIALQQYLKHNSLSLKDILKIAIQLTEILQGLYLNRVIHKDIKPGNILINPKDRQVKLIDFSIASLLPKEMQEIRSPNVLEGTLAYLSPEQTGRMNRGIDYRSDFYSLGVTLYEILTGNLPFNSTDPMELIHCHIAQLPQSVSAVKPDIPEGISQIVSKLMAKNAEERYQSTLGLKFDLEECLQQLETKGKIQTFPLGWRDICDRFLIPEILYGREAEVESLLNAFDRVARGSAELMLVAGFSGIGKTAVVNEVHKPIVRQRGYFIKGKFDQFNRNIPFSAFVQAFRDLMGQLLTENDVRLQEWRNNILEALGDNGQVIIEVIPELEAIVGPQPPAAELSGMGGQNRFNRLFQKLIQVFTTTDHPLVIFLDDLQWADLASIKLMELLVCESQTGYLLLIGAYRDNEVFPAHPLMLTLDEMRTTGAVLNTITLKPLSSSSVNQLVADTLACPSELAQPLTELIYQKTKGNAFFATQFLKALHQENFLYFDRQAGYWLCDLTAIRETILTEDIVEFMAHQLLKFSRETQEVLQLAACLGNQFDLYTLAIVAEQSDTDVATVLWKALQEGLILPQSEIYKFYLEAELSPHQNSPIDPHPLTLQYRFLHDRVQQAAYSLIPPEQKQETHLKIGRLLWQQKTPEELESNLFNIVNQLNIGSDLMEQASERKELAKLNLMAARKAKASTAYEPALKYSEISLTLLPETAWSTDYQLMLELHEEATETAYLQGAFDRMQYWADRALEQTRVLLDRIKVYEIIILTAVAQHQEEKALEQGLEVLRLLGLSLPASPSPEDVQQALQELVSLTPKTGIESLKELPIMTHGNALAALRISNTIAAAAYTASRLLFTLIALAQVKLSIQYGNAPESASAYAHYGIILCGITNEIEAGYRFGQLALSLLSPSQKFINSRVFFVAAAYTVHWRAHLQETIPLLQLGYQAGIESGNLELAAWNYCLEGKYSYWVGQELNDLERKLFNYCQVGRQIKQPRPLSYTQMAHQAVLNLLGRSPKAYRLIGEAYNEEQELPIYLATHDVMGLSYFYVHKLILAYLFGQYSEALSYATEAFNALEGGTAQPGVVLLYVYDSLIRLALFETLSTSEKLGFLEKVSANQEKVQYWAECAPPNHQHKFDLVEAERYRIQGKKLQAIELYERAIEGAKDNGYMQEEALANELTARFYLDWGKDKAAKSYLYEAYYAYSRWGAKAKVDELEQRYFSLLQPLLLQQQLNSSPFTNFQALTPSSYLAYDPKTVSHSSTTNLSDSLDLATILKASQALSRPIELDQLIATLMQVLLQNSGAQKGVLFIPQNDRLSIQAIAYLNGIQTEQLITIATSCADENQEAPLKVIYAVKNTLQPLSIPNLQQETTWIGDPYFATHTPASLLATPILNQGKLIAILYLENRLATATFTRERLELIDLLCTQAAISLENARLYQQSQRYAQQLERSLQELQQAQLQIVQSEKMSALGNLVAGVAHEVNNPLGFLAGNLNPAQEYVQDLLGLIELYQQEYPTATPTIAEYIDEIDLNYLREDLPKLLSSMHVGVERIRGISNSLRTFSRTDRDYKVPFDLHTGLESTLLILKHRLKGSERYPPIETIREYGDLPPIDCFPGQLNQVFMNLLANAIDALNEASEGLNFAEIYNYISIKTARLGDDRVSVEIADNGIGMTDEVKHRIFEHLFTTKPVGQGTGLGLAIARQIIVEKHGGTIDVHSTPRKGTHFIITLPITASQTSI